LPAALIGLSCYRARVATDIRIGTASWTDPGFVEDWYPPKLPASARLRWYTEHFNYVEINATFYAIPAARTVERWVTETPDDFLFDVKLPKVLSHHRMQAKFLPPALRSKVPLQGAYVELNPKTEQLVVQSLLRELKPLCEAKKLGAFLLQLSPSFRPKTHELSELDSLRDLLWDHLLAVELRNRDWVEGEQLNATLDYFRRQKIICVSVDAPQSEHFTVMPGLNYVTNPELAYFRFHGRNEEGYIKGRTVADRFDHDYSESEVAEIAQRLRNIEPQVQRLHAAANNNRSNYAPKFASRLREILSERDELRKALAIKQRKPAQGQLL
jgi:uncharacterized protein YecE (DUF72 family)